jgi:hypothetical protein
MPCEHARARLHRRRQLLVGGEGGAHVHHVKYAPHALRVGALIHAARRPPEAHVRATDPKASVCCGSGQRSARVRAQRRGTGGTRAWSAARTRGCGWAREGRFVRRRPAVRRGLRRGKEAGPQGSHVTWWRTGGASDKRTPLRQQRSVSIYIPRAQRSSRQPWRSACCAHRRRRAPPPAHSRARPLATTPRGSSRRRRRRCPPRRAAERASAAAGARRARCACRRRRRRRKVRARAPTPALREST